MELLVASAIGVLTAGGIYLLLRQRTFPVIVGLSLLSYAVNIFLFATGRLTVGAPPVLRDGVTIYTDPLPQALVLTAIVISFGMTAVIVMIALSAYLSENDDRIDMTDRVEDDA
ncbi:Na+/H+ antiporter subunit C [Arenibacterium halophilum]|uniref:Na+/H+ antiporter subunit C n=1 Tax=Arenibacterium halophilum TaxID=2583821 RepID=A0ABY2XDB6_9RHOB|nr:Na+/H+ antiporter subunit C [Arenibacterium halophilum]TMV13717.1 Na+/H+ antiporter subunit C [Arenibacterium halophilum]